MSAPKVTKVAPVEDKSRNMYAQWQWGKKQCASYSHTDHYEVAWHYLTSNTGWLVGGTDNNVSYQTKSSICSSYSCSHMAQSS